MPRKTATQAYPHPRIPLTPDLSLTAAGAQAKGHWKSDDLWPEGTRQDAIALAGKLLIRANQLGVAALSDLRGRTARRVVADVAGVEDLSNSLSHHERESVRLVRNTLLAIHATAALVQRTPQLASGEDADHPTPAFPRQVDHRCGRPRPWFDDEIALMRLRVAGLTHPRSLRVANAYLLLEAGAYPADLPTAMASRLDDLAEPTKIHLDADGTRGDRVVPLTSFGSWLLARNLRLMRQHDLAAPERLTFTGANPDGDPAVQSVYGFATDLAAWAGVNDRYTNVSGISFWRHRHIILNESYHDGFVVAFGEPAAFTPKQLEQRERRLLTNVQLNIRDLA